MAADPADEDPRPWYAPERDMGSRKAATEIAQAPVCRVYKKLNNWICGSMGGKGGRFAYSEERRLVFRQPAQPEPEDSIVTLARYWKEVRDDQGSITPEKRRAPQRRKAEEWAARDALRKGIGDLHEMGEVSHLGNLLLHAMEDLDGPFCPNDKDRYSGRYYRGADLDTRGGRSLSPMRAGRRASPGGARPTAIDAPGKLQAMTSFGRAYSWAPRLSTRTTLGGTPGHRP